MPMQRGAVVFYVLVVAVMSFAVGHYVGFARGDITSVRNIEIPVVGEAEEGFFFPEEPATPREIDDRVDERSDVSDDDVINGIRVGGPEENEKATLAGELISHFKELAARAVTPYGPVIAETAMAQRIHFADASWTEPMAAIVFQTEDGHWWKVCAERNADGSWWYDCPSHEDSPLTYDTEATLEVVPPLAGPLAGFPLKRVGIVERFLRANTIIPKSDG